MIELAQHIEALLLENDCVIVPGLGGFITHYNPASMIEKENLFLPPIRVIGFNAQLKMNDGLLAQSYMAVYGTNFPDANKMVQSHVKSLIAALHENGKADLPNIGELRYSIHNTYDFQPYDNKITTPYLYGLDTFEMLQWTELERLQSVKTPLRPSVPNKERRSISIRFNTAYLSTAAAVVAAIVLSFFFSTPIENTEVIEENYAKVLPSEIFEKLEKHSLAINPVVVNMPENKPAASEKLKESGIGKKIANPITAKEVKVNKVVTNAAENTSGLSTATPGTQAHSEKSEITADKENGRSSGAEESASNVSEKTFHIIIASVGTERDAKAMAEHLVAKGYKEAKAIIGDGKMRVSIESCATEAEAYQAMNKIKGNGNYKNAWVLGK